MPSIQSQFSPEQIAVVKNYRKIEELLPSHWQESFVEANSLRHHYYRTGGEKPQLVLLHGLQESAICWLRVAKALEQDYRIAGLKAPVIHAGDEKPFLLGWLGTTVDKRRRSN